jgi:hypothetical protein
MNILLVWLEVAGGLVAAGSLHVNAPVVMLV